MNARAILASLLFVVGCGKDHSGHDDHHHGNHEEPSRSGHHDPERPGDEVHLTPEGLERARITVGKAAPRLIGGDARIPAEVQLMPQRTAHVAPLSPGRLIRVDAQPGQTVKAGQVLAVVSSTEVASLVAKSEELRAQLASARSTFDRQKKLAVDGIASQRAVIDAESLVRQLQAEATGVARLLELLGAKDGKPELELVSPIDGVVVEAHATRGEMTKNDDPPFVVADPSEVWVIGQVPELKVKSAAIGKRVRFRLGAYAGEHWEGLIEFVSPSLDARTRSLPIRISLPNPDGRLRAGLFGTLEILSGGDDDAPVITVPTESLIVLDGRDAVFVPGDEPGAFEPRFITLGRRDVGFVEVTDGLAANASVVTSGAFTLKSVLQKGVLAEHQH